MRRAILLLRYKLLQAVRFSLENLYVLLLLGPAITLIVYLIVEPYLQAMADGVYQVPSVEQMEIIGSALLLLALLSPISTVAAEFYPVQSADSYLDGLPVSLSQRYISILLIRLGKNLPLILIITILVCATALKRGTVPDPVALAVNLVLIWLQLAALQSVLAVFGAHYEMLDGSRLLPIAGLYMAAALYIAAYLPLAGALDAFICLTESLFTGSLQTPPPARIALSLAVTFLSMAVSFLGYSKWAITDRDAVERHLSQTATIPLVEKVATWIERGWGAQVACQLVRDLLLTFRFFSSSVYLSVASAALFEVAVVVFATRYGNVGVEFEIAVQAACALATFALSALAVAMVRYQMRFFALERPLPLRAADLYQAKLLYARLVSLPVPICTAILSLIVGDLSLADVGMLALKLLLVWLLVASIVGGLVFEMASRPALAIPFIAIASLSIVSLTIRLWWLWVIIYPYLIDKLEARGRQRAYLYLIGVERAE